MKTSRRRDRGGASSITRRAALGIGSAIALAGVAPAIHLRRRPRLRVLGTHVTLQEAIRRRAMEDLGIELVFEPGGSAAVLQRASTRPESFDVYEQWSNSIEVLWNARAIQPIDRDRIEHWGDVNDLCKVGRLDPDAPRGRGAEPVSLVNVQPDGALGEEPSRWLSFVPYVHNADSFGYDADVCGEREEFVTESWAMLLDPQWRGRVGIVNEPTIGLFDLALAAEAAGLVTFEDVGALTREELDRLFDVLLELEGNGHFAAFWSSVPHSVELMQSGRVVVESMFSPAAAALRAAGKRVIYAAPKEGYRAWHGVMCLSSQASEEAVEAAYAYMNWWLSGWPGAFVARQGYYISTPELSRAHLSSEEWDYWYGGRPASSTLLGVDGSPIVRAGERRRGGSYERRLSSVAVWNTVMDTYEYSMRGWYSLLNS